MMTDKSTCTGYQYPFKFVHVPICFPQVFDRFEQFMGGLAGRPYFSCIKRPRALGSPLAELPLLTAQNFRSREHRSRSRSNCARQLVAARLTTRMPPSRGGPATT